MIKNKKGFTLIELMIVVAIIGILAAVAIPKFANMLEKAREGATKGNIGALKSALSIYYGDNQGEFPEQLDGADFTGANGYIDRIPPVKVKHPASQFGENELTGTETSVTHVDTPNLAWPDDGDGWLYASDGTEKGNIWIYNGQTDTNGTPYADYGYE